ncbi:quinoprotein relay system zinc metallohydrolase 2 [Actibacterium lipolyticum]|uniref:Hydroxyacylglutathione hydrolase n=1 Tax=Actibacterium lipolyticum TaxID=1524263 RepID=A0A238JNZ6_9RHOB|nr:quinoprotein relay system zinc metallohydrolase 2 [Actibacterium lipolyticum]SMX32371.1 Hydroxyacylglutathione hydrolase [Actibacterium lipolyticum]
MFEAVILLCLEAAPDSCRQVMVPGYEAAQLATCQSHLATAEALRFNGPADCADQGPVAEFHEIADGVFAHRGIISDADRANKGDVANIAFVLGDTAIAVIDSGGSRLVGEKVYRAIRAKSGLPITHAILTHMHPDHMLGATVFEDAGAQVVGHTNLGRALADRQESYLSSFGGLIGPDFIGTQVPATDIEVAQTLSVDLGGRTLELTAWRQAHTSTDLTVRDSKTGVLFSGDLVFAEHAPALDGSLVGWQSVLDELVSQPASGVVPGHGGPYLPWPQAAAMLQHYLDVLAQETRAAIAAGESLGNAVEHIAEGEAENWQLFDLFNPRNATVAYTELEWE